MMTQTPLSRRACHVLISHFPTPRIILKILGDYIPDGTYVSISDGILRSFSISHRVRAVLCGKSLPRCEDGRGAVPPQTALRLVWGYGDYVSPRRCGMAQKRTICYRFVEIGLALS